MLPRRQGAATRRAGAIAALLAALSPALIWYSQEARAYGLLVLMSAGSLLYFARSLRTLGPAGSDRDQPFQPGMGGRPPPRAKHQHRRWSRHATNLTMWTLLASLARMTHYFAAFIIAPQGASLWRGAHRRHRRQLVLASGVVAGVGLALVPLVLRQQAAGGARWIGSLPLGDRLADVPPQSLLGEGRPLYHYFALAVGLAAIAPLASLMLRRPRDVRHDALTRVGIAACAVAIPVLVDVAGAPIVIDRNMMGVAIPLLLACSLAMARRGSRVGLGSFVVLAGLWIWATAQVLSNPLLQREDWRDAAKALGRPSLTRVVLYAPATNNPAPVPPLVPFQAVYLKSLQTMPDRGATVSEIDVLNVRDDLSDLAPPPDPISPGRKFHLISRAGHRTFTLFRFVAAEPVRVTPDELIGDDLLANRDENDTLVGLQVAPATPVSSTATGAKPASVRRY